MKGILLLILFYTPIYGQEDKLLMNQIQTLIPFYQEYITKLKTPNSKINPIESQILNIPITITDISFINNQYKFKMLELDLFNALTELSSLSKQNKQFTAEMDLAKLQSSLFILSNLSTLSSQYLPQQKHSFFRNLYINGETRLLALAKKALHAPTQEAEVLDTEFNLIIRYLSSIPFPAEYSFYRRRMRFSIAFPQAAQQEIDRIHQNLLNMS